MRKLIHVCVCVCVCVIVRVAASGPMTNKPMVFLATKAYNTFFVVDNMSNIHRISIFLPDP